MYNENDLTKIWYACKGGMKNHQVAKFMGITEVEAIGMLAAAHEKFGSVRKERSPSERKVYFRHRAISEESKREFVRPAAKYDNKSSEERINEYLSMEI